MWIRQGSGLGVIVIAGDDDDVEEKNRPDRHDPPCRQWGMHKGGAYFGPGVGSRGLMLESGRGGSGGAVSACIASILASSIVSLVE